MCIMLPALVSCVGAEAGSGAGPPAASRSRLRLLGMAIVHLLLLVAQVQGQLQPQGALQPAGGGPVANTQSDGTSTGVDAGAVMPGAGAGAGTAPTSPPVGSDEWADRVAGAANCKIIFTSSYGYRQFFLLGDALSRKADNPMDGYPYPLPPLSAPTPAPELVNGSSGSPTPATQRGTSAPKRGPSLDRRVLLHFQVMAESDAHILISAQRRSDREAYEVVLGAGSNSYTDFRRLPATIPPRRAFNYSSGVVSGSELRAFWLLAELDTGLLAVGPVGGAPILAWVDPEPVNLRYFSLCTWTDVPGTWLYGCDEVHAQQAASGSGPLDAEGTPPAQRLLLDVVLPRKGHAPHAAQVSSRLLVDHFTVDDRNGILSVYGTLRMEWLDDRLTWSPANFSGLNHTQLSPDDVWTPSLQELEPVRLGSTATATAMAAPASIRLSASGHLRLRAAVRLQAWCASSESESESAFKCQLGLALGPARPAPSPPSLVQHQLVLTVELSGPPTNADWEWQRSAVVSHSESEGLQGAAVDRGGGEGDSTHQQMQQLRAQQVEVLVQLRRLGSRLSCIFIATYTAACMACALSLAFPLEPPGEAGARAEVGARADRALLLLRSLSLLLVAFALVSLPLPQPEGEVARLCLSSVLLVEGVALLLLLPRLHLLSVSAGDRPHPRPFPKLLQRGLHSTVAQLLLCHQGAEGSPRWRESPGSAEHALQILDAMEAEEWRRDWALLSGALARLSALASLALMAAALAF